LNRGTGADRGGDTNATTGDVPSPVKYKVVILRILGFLALASIAFAQSSSSLRGKLIQQPDKDPVIEAGGRRVAIEADEDTWKVLRDERLAGADVELLGHANDAEHFTVAGTHLHPVYVWRDRKRLYVTYWCDVCYIRTYVPGNCWCCQKYTVLDLREKLDDQ
jgi:hypothetical protein